MSGILKLMTSNVWADVFGNPVSPRDVYLAGIVGDEEPDVLFLQEMHPNWHRSRLKPALEELGYKESKPVLPSEQKLNYTPLFYKKSRFAEKASGFLLYEGLNDYDSKSVSYSLLELKDSGETFAACSTHMYFAQNEEGEKARLDNARQLAGFCGSFPEGTPFFCGGDFNCDIGSAPFRFLNENGIWCASLFAENKVNFIRTDHLNPVYDKKAGKYIPADSSQSSNSESIDHIVFKGNAEILSYKVISDMRALVLSDHCPVVVEAKI